MIQNPYLPTTVYWDNWEKPRCWWDSPETGHLGLAWTSNLKCIFDEGTHKTWTLDMSIKISICKIRIFQFDAYGWTLVVRLRSRESFLYYVTCFFFNQIIFYIDIKQTPKKIRALQSLKHIRSFLSQVLQSHLFQDFFGIWRLTQNCDFVQRSTGWKEFEQREPNPWLTFHCTEWCMTGSGIVPYHSYHNL